MQTTKRLPYYLSLVFLAYMPFHIFISQSVSLLTGGLDAWKIAKDALLALATLFVICLMWARGVVDKTTWKLVVFTAGYGLLHALLWAAHPDIYKNSALLGATYNVRLVCFLIVGYGAVRLLGPAFRWQPVLRVVIGVSTVVAALGIIQYFLPKDTLTHIGYGIDRGVRANFAIDDAAGLTRVMSTLRDPNSLGAFLLVPLTLLAALITSPRFKKYRVLGFSAFAVMAVALLMTFSRSAWMAAIVSIGLVMLWQFRDKVVLFAKRFGIAFAILVVGFSVFAYTQRHSSFVTSYISHSSQGSQDIDSNEYHWLFVKQGINGIIANPLGHGPGTAGLASIQNPKGSFLTENYYVQVGYELGIVGLAAFVGLQVWLYIRLWRSRQHGVMPTVLLATFWGYVLMNMLLHTWSNEAVACQWWILAGMAIAEQSATKSSAKRV